MHLDSRFLTFFSTTDTDLSNFFYSRESLISVYLIRETTKYVKKFTLQLLLRIVKMYLFKFLLIFITFITIIYIKQMLKYYRSVVLILKCLSSFKFEKEQIYTYINIFYSNNNTIIKYSTFKLTWQENIKLISLIHLILYSQIHIFRTELDAKKIEKLINY